MTPRSDNDPLTTLLIACVTLLVYDYALTFQREVELVWKRKWGLGTILFAFNRYSPFIEGVISLSIRFFVLSPQLCGKLSAILTWFIVLGLLTSEFVLMLRTYAIWDRSRTALYILLATGTLVSVLGIVSTEMELRSLKWTHGPGDDTGCFVSEAGTIIFLAYISLLICETTIAIMTAIKALSHLRRSHSDFVVTLYRDGFLFYLYCIGISLLNIILTVTGPGLVNWLATLQHIIHSICCTRVLFFIFKSQHRVETWNLEGSGQALPTTSIYFTSILPPPATGQNEEIQMGHAGSRDMETVYSGCEVIRYEEPLSGGAGSVEEQGHCYVERLG